MSETEDTSPETPAAKVQALARSRMSDVVVVVVALLGVIALIFAGKADVSTFMVTLGYWFAWQAPSASSRGAGAPPR